MAKSCWDIGTYALSFRGAIGLICWYQLCVLLCWIVGWLGMHYWVESAIIHSLYTASMRLVQLMYVWRWTLKYFSSNESSSCFLIISSVFTIWRHWYTCVAYCWIHLGASASAAFSDTGADFVGHAVHSNLCPVTFQYVSGYIARPKIPCCPPPSSDWMVDTLAWILRCISQMIL